MQWFGAAEKVQIYVNSKRKTMQQVRVETGCDIIINGGLYDMARYAPVCHLKVDGKVLASDKYTYLGYGWNDDANLQLITDYSAVKNYICCVCMVRDGKRQTMWFDDAVCSGRARTAIGTMPNGYLWVYIGSNPQTPESLQDTAMLAGVKDAIMLDGGGSTQGIIPAGMITAPRRVHNYICIWTRKDVNGTAPIINQAIANRGNYGSERNTNTIRYIVMHYTGNDGDSDASNARYFQNNIVKTSAHYFVDDDSITQSVPDDRIAWHCGAKKYYHAEARNANSIGVELCDNKRDGSVYPSQATIDRALDLVRWLMKKYGVPADRVIRHYDVSHKLCPAYWCGTTAKDMLWRSAFHNKLTNTNATEKEGTNKVTLELNILKRGSKGSEVIALQSLLKGRGYDPSGIDGSFGPGCEAALRRWQSNMSLEVDGICGPATWASFFGK